MVLLSSSLSSHLSFNCTANTTAFFSITITIANKGVFHWFSFPGPNTLITAQMFASVGFLCLLKSLKMLNYAPLESVTAWKVPDKLIPAFANLIAASTGGIIFAHGCTWVGITQVCDSADLLRNSETHPGCDIDNSVFHVGQIGFSWRSSVSDSDGDW